MGRLTARAADLREIIKAGPSLEKIAERVLSINGDKLSRQRIQQLLKRYSLWAEWKKYRKKEVSREQVRRNIRRIAALARGRVFISILLKAEKQGYEVKWGRTMKECRLEGFPIAVHHLAAEFNNHYHTVSWRTSGIRICVFPTGKSIMVMPTFKRHDPISISATKALVGPDEWVEPEKIREVYEKRKQQLTRARIAGLYRKQKYGV